MGQRVGLTSKLDPASVSALQECVYDLRGCYLPVNLNSSHYKNKRQALEKLVLLMKKPAAQLLSEVEHDEVLQCSLTLLYYFGLRLKLKQLTSHRRARCMNYSQRKLFHKAESAYKKVMATLLPDCSHSTIMGTLKFITEVKLWRYEGFVCQILEVVLYFTRSDTILFHLMLTDVHRIIFTDILSARQRMKVLYELLNSPYWDVSKQKLLPLVTRLLDFFTYSLTRDNNKISPYRYLKKGLEVCLRRIFERAGNSNMLGIITTMLNWFSMVNLNSDEMLEFSSLLDYATSKYTVGLYERSFRPGLFEHVLNRLVGSSDPIYNLLGCRLLQRFLDRQGNATFLLNPTIYYEFTQVHLTIGDYEVTDKSFVRQHRDHFHEYLLKGIVLHCSKSINLKAMFCVVCCLILEVPCGLTAAAAACLMMSVQDYALHGDNVPPTCRYWLHAIVLSVMSLICWVHRAPILYRYVNQIVARRSIEAPQLNPPLMKTYNISPHHITWNKPSLFFEDWELRYGLWKHFQDSKATRISKTGKLATKFSKKMPSVDLRR